MAKFDKDSSYGKLILGAIEDYDRTVGRDPQEADRLGGSLWAPVDLEEDLDRAIQVFQGFYDLPLNSSQTASVPRYGLLSLLSRNTKFFVYAHPALKKFATTAFTDGINVFFADTFLDELLYSAQNNPNTRGVEFTIGHELSHKFRRHNTRLNYYGHALANEATDLSINTNMILAFPEMKPCPLLISTGLGFKEGDKERYSTMSEEAIAEHLLAMRNNGFSKNRKEEPSDSPPSQGKGSSGGNSGSGSGNGGGSGSGSGGDSSSGSGGNSEPNYDKMHEDRLKRDPLAPMTTSEALENLNDLLGESQERHYISPEELIETLQDYGMENIIEKMGYPTDISTEEGENALEAIEQKAIAKDMDAILSAANERRKYGDKYPGAHMVDQAEDLINKLGKGVLGWKLKMRKALAIPGNKTHMTYDFPNEIYYVDEVSNMLGMELYLPGTAPAKNDDIVVFVIDTSGSMDREALKAAAQEAVHLQKESDGLGDSAAEVFVVPCDTAIRGKPILINSNNVNEFLDKGIVLSGRGGTSLEDSLRMVADLDLFKKKKIKSIVYASDLYDSPVVKLPPKLVKDGCKICFLADPATPLEHVENFARQSNPSLDIYRIEKGVTIDLSGETPTAKDTVLNRKKRKFR